MQEHEEDEKNMFPGLDFILPLAVPEQQILVSSVEDAKCLLKEELSGSYGRMLDWHLL